ncbi:MAG: RdgB/HAM1 family non-canonical purine NTP pyrophosphatase [Candidatus Acidiferrales bacterium]|jgi:XTP/dITP diphosphohydrolase
MKPLGLFLASSNSGKLREYRELAGNSPVQLELIPNFNDIPAFDETAPTFAGNSAGKALHYSQFTSELILADDSGLVVPALDGAPGVYSARYAGPGASDADRLQKLLRQMQGKQAADRRARFICVVTLARNSRALAIVSDFAEGTLTLEPHGKEGFGYDPLFFSSELGCTFAEASQREKNHYSHRGRAFRKLLELLLSPSNSLTLS